MENENQKLEGHFHYYEKNPITDPDVGMNMFHRQIFTLTDFKILMERMGKPLARPSMAFNAFLFPGSRKERHYETEILINLFETPRSAMEQWFLDQWFLDLGRKNIGDVEEQYKDFQRDLMIDIMKGINDETMMCMFCNVCNCIHVDAFSTTIPWDKHVRDLLADEFAALINAGFSSMRAVKNSKVDIDGLESFMVMGLCYIPTSEHDPFVYYDYDMLPEWQKERIKATEEEYPERTFWVRSLHPNDNVYRYVCFPG